MDGFYDSSYRKDFFILIDSFGHVFWDFGGTIRTHCPMDITYYPYDTQTCSLTLGSWMYNLSEVKLIPYLPYPYKGIVLSNSLWEFKYFEYGNDTQLDDAFGFVKYSYTYKRKALYYEVNIFIPIIFLFIVAMGGFWIPADSGEKASICITVLLAFSVYQLIITERTPVTSDVTPNISKYI